MTLNGWRALFLTLTFASLAAQAQVPGKPQLNDAPSPANYPRLIVPAVPHVGAAPSPPSLGQDTDIDAALRKMNAFTEFANRTARAAESWERYKSWVDIARGPTGKERYIDYGLYSLYDVRDEAKAVRAAMAMAPNLPELDEAMGQYLTAYETLAPIITAAYGYYERKDYLVDDAERGRELHRQLVPAAEAFLAARERLEAVARPIAADLSTRELAMIETREGRGARWQVRNTMVEARRVIDVLKAPGTLDQSALDRAIAAFATAVKEFDAFTTANPDKIMAYGDQPNSFLGRLRQLQVRLRSRGVDARTEADNVVSSFSMMTTTSDVALRLMQIRR